MVIGVVQFALPATSLQTRHQISVSMPLRECVDYAAAEDWSRVTVLLSRASDVGITLSGVVVLQLMPGSRSAGGRVNWGAHLEASLVSPVQCRNTLRRCPPLVIFAIASRLLRSSIDLFPVGCHDLLVGTGVSASPA